MATAATTILSTSRLLRKMSTVLQRLISSEHLLRQQSFIDGHWVEASSGKRFNVVNPANNEVIASVPNCQKDDCEKAVASASKAFDTWGFQTTAKERHDLLMKLYDLMIKNKDDLAKIMTIEQGKPLAESLGEVAYAAGFIEWFAAEARRKYGEIVPPPTGGRQVLFYNEPVGVAAMITPWNFPSAMITRKAGAALAAGCTCIIKPAEDTPLSALALAALAEEAGFPHGVFNVVTCDRDNTAEVGQHLCQAPDIRKISFTGSTAVGKLLLQQSAGTVKRVSLELGGNAPFIVFDSADIDKAVVGAMNSRFRNSGQTCVCADRFFVHEDVHDSFTAKLTDAVKKLKLGAGLDDGITQGPLINNRAVDKVSRLVGDAQSHGAKLHCGGEPAVAVGPNYYQPTILTDVTPDMSIMQEEIFGPVVPIVKFKTEQEALSLANDCPVGLSGYFYSQDISQIFRVARQLQVGMVGVNEALISGVEIAFGGVKESGLGREGSHHGIDEYMNVKYVCLGGLS